MIQPGSITLCSGNFCYVLCTINILFALLTVPENAIVIAALHKISKGKRWKVPNMLMAVLATTDLLSGLISQTLYAYFLYKQARYFGNEHIAYGTEDFWALLVLNYSSYTLCGLSLLLVALMAVDRLHAIAYPILYRQRTYRRRLIGAIVGIAIFCAFIPILRIISLSTVSIFTIVISATVGSALIITIASYAILLYMFRRLQSRRSYGKETDKLRKPSTTSNWSCRDKRLTKSFAIIGGTLIFMYLPQLLLKPFTLSENKTLNSFPISIEDLANTILYCNSFINPLLFAFRHKEVRAAVINLVCCVSTDTSDNEVGSITRRSVRHSVKLNDTSSSHEIEQIE